MTNLANHLQTGQIPKPYRRGSWRPIGHMRPSSPLLDSVRDIFEGYEQLGGDFAKAFQGNAKFICDVAFNVMGHPTNGSKTDTSIRRIYGVRAILAIRSRVFLEMLYGFVPPGTAPHPTEAIASPPPPKTASGKPPKPEKKPSDKPRKRGSITAETMHKIAQIPKIIQTSEARARRKESIAAAKTPTYLTVPGTGSAGTTSSGDGSSGGIRAAFSRLVSGSWAGWGSKNRTDSMKRWQSESIYAKMDIGEAGMECPGLSVCADLAKIDRNKLAQTEVRLVTE